MEEKSKISILVTAGSVWCPIDQVRVITNIFGGTLGLSIINKLQNNTNNAITLLFAAGSEKIDLNKINKNVKIERAKYFEGFKTKLYQLLKNNKYDYVIHSAAVADFKLNRVPNYKISSKTKYLNLTFTPTEKLVDKIKIYQPNTFLIKFKLETNKTIKELIKISISSIKDSDADLIIANRFEDLRPIHKAYFIKPEGDYKLIKGKAKIADEIEKIVGNQ